MVPHGQAVASQGLRTEAPVGATSAAFRVTNTSPCTIAVAASRPSTTGTFALDCDSSVPAIFPQRRATASSTGRIRPENRGRNSASSEGGLYFCWRSSQECSKGAGHPAGAGPGQRPGSAGQCSAGAPVGPKITGPAGPTYCGPRRQPWEKGGSSIGYPAPAGATESSHQTTKRGSNSTPCFFSNATTSSR
jgi:hypothetical protein